VVIASCFGDVAFGDASPEFQEDKRTSYAAGIARFEKGIAARYGALYVPNMQADIKPLAEKKQYWSDNNHPNKAGNEFVAKRILVELQKALQREKSPPGPIPLRRGCSSHQTPTATRLPRTGGSV